MEKTREARSSSSTVAANGSSRRRSRATVFRDLPGMNFDFRLFVFCCVILDDSFRFRFMRMVV